VEEAIDDARLVRRRSVLVEFRVGVDALDTKLDPDDAPELLFDEGRWGIRHVPGLRAAVLVAVGEPPEPFGVVMTQAAPRRWTLE
jgi:hypothetical protein